MSRNIEQPTERINSRSGNAELHHPAYAMIGASRCSGHASLFGSGHQHHHYVRLSIKHAHSYRDLSNDHYSADNEIIEGALSETQWASLIANMNVGNGVPCTLGRYQGKLIPELPDTTPQTEKYREDLEEHMASIRERLAEVSQTIQNSKLSQTAKTELTRSINCISHSLVGSFGFVADQFDEAIESVVSSAKTDINQHLAKAVDIANLRAIAETAQLALPAPKTEPSNDGDSV